MKFHRFMIHASDRAGMTLEVLKLFYGHGINLTDIEVEPGTICVKFEQDAGCDIGTLISDVSNLDGVVDIHDIELIPSEEKQKYLNTVLNAISEGIIAVDKQGMITKMNPAAEKILKVKKENAAGKNISTFFSAQLPIEKTISKGEPYNNVEIMLNNGSDHSHYITSGRPILDEDDKPIGAVATLQDIESVMDLVYSFTASPMVTFDDIIGESKKIKRVEAIAKSVAKGNSTVLIRGETGTGKELFARSIHMASLRRNKPFVAVNCAALPDTLLESELFGYDEGAFTGAKKGGKQGLFKYADKGTIFLDEIGEIPTHIQVKLLRVLQERKIRKVGSEEEIPVDVRVIAATNRNLEKMVANGQFREDLYYRLNVIPIFLPPLRERKDDIPVLAWHFINTLSQKLGREDVKGIDDAAMNKLMNYDWPGNIRELSNIIERALNLCNDYIQPEHLIIDEQEINSSCMPAYDKNLKLKDVVAQAEEDVIGLTLNESSSIRKAAVKLGISHSTLITKMKKYGIERKRS